MRSKRSVAILSICLTASLTVGCGKNRGRASETDSGIDPIGELCMKEPGNERCTGSIQVALNTCPRVSVTATPLQVKLGQSASLALGVIDAEGDTVEVEWQVDPDGAVDTSQATASYLCESLGRKTITVFVTDARECESVSMVEFACLDPENFEGSGMDPLP